MAYRGNYTKKEHAFKTVSKDLKEGRIGGAVLLRGTEQYLVTWAKNMIIKEYVPDATRPLDLAVFSPDNLDVQQVIASCQTPPVMAEKKVVVLDNFYLLWGGRQAGFGDDEKDDLKECFKTVPDDCILLVCAPEPEDSRTARFGTSLSKALTASGREYDFGTLEKSQLLGFMKKRMVAMGKQAGRHTMEKMIEESGYYNKEIDYDLYNFSGDIEKVCAFSDSDLITDKAVDECLSDNLEHNIFRLLDCISEKRKEEAIRLLHDIVRSGTDEYAVLYQLFSQFDLMLAVRSMSIRGISKKAMAKELGGMHEYRLQKLINAGRRYSEDQLAVMLRRTVETERRLKSGKMDPSFALELLIADF